MMRFPLLLTVALASVLLPAPTGADAPSPLVHLTDARGEIEVHAVHLAVNVAAPEIDLLEIRADAVGDSVVVTFLVDDLRHRTFADELIELGLVFRSDLSRWTSVGAWWVPAAGWHPRLLAVRPDGSQEAIWPEFEVDWDAGRIELTVPARFFEGTIERAAGGGALAPRSGEHYRGGGPVAFRDWVNSGGTEVSLDPLPFPSAWSRDESIGEPNRGFPLALP